MKKILVKVPTKREKRFMCCFNGGAAFYRLTANKIFNRIEGRVLATREKGKNPSEDKGVYLYVKYPEGHNDGVYDAPKPLLYALACFLEDYLPVSFAKRKYKRFLMEKI